MGPHPEGFPTDSSPAKCYDCVEFFKRFDVGCNGDLTGFSGIFMGFSDSSDNFIEILQGRNGPLFQQVGEHVMYFWLVKHLGGSMWFLWFVDTGAFLEMISRFIGVCHGLPTRWDFPFVVVKTPTWSSKPSNPI